MAIRYERLPGCRLALSFKTPVSDDQLTMAPIEDNVVTPMQNPLETRPHVLFLNRSFWPDTEATGQLLTELTTDLTRWFDVTVVAGRPNHVDEVARDTDSLANEYHGVKVQRVWHTKFSKHSKLGRLTNLLTFTFASWIAASRLRNRPDVIVVETDPFFLPLIGRRLRRQFGNCPLVCYLQDLYPDIAIAVGKVREGWLTRTIRNLLFNVYRNAQKTIVLSRDMQKRCEEYGVPSDRLEVIPNWADTDVVRPLKSNNEFRRQQELGGKFVVMYSGNMGLAHDLETLIDAAALLHDRTDIEWLFIGEGAQREKLKKRATELGLSQARFLPYQPRSFLTHSLSAADVHLISVLPGATACVMPSKLYGILASGTSSIAIVEPESELSELINEQQVGFTCVPGDAELLAERIRELADNPELRQQQGDNARMLAETTFSRARQTTRFGKLLCQVLEIELPESLNLSDLPPQQHQSAIELAVDPQVAAIPAR